jgi:hypothetical protein
MVRVSSKPFIADAVLTTPLLMKGEILAYLSRCTEPLGHAGGGAISIMEKHRRFLQNIDETSKRGTER